MLYVFAQSRESFIAEGARPHQFAVISMILITSRVRVLLSAASALQEKFVMFDHGLDFAVQSSPEI